ncbi:hypothetical protein TL16_g01250 [Triparma laevis f. inornata]|uniref:Uncharacterized protein n=1 Tax=Triparma laevis f. inornata TaxID=1714386 RepID=A0A9W7DQK5_9STRA|nr:hypothetical protein TL16_g01250 [Triparma laevis f. inornata]
MKTHIARAENFMKTASKKSRTRGIAAAGSTGPANSTGSAKPHPIRVFPADNYNRGGNCIAAAGSTGLANPHPIRFS